MLILSPITSRLSLLLVAVLLAGSLLSVAPVTHAQSKTSTCLKQFGTFVSSLLSTGSANEYWKDLLKRNQCQQADIFSLQDQVEARMKELREEYYDSCSSSEIPTLQKEIREKKMEIDFVRFIVPVFESTMTQKDSEGFFKDDFEPGKINLKQTMKKTYVDQKKWVSEERFNALFESWVTRYEPRFKTYLNCEDSAWAEVADKWKEFEDQLQEVLEFFKGTDEDADKQAALAEKERLEKEKEANLKTGGEKNAPESAIMGFLKKHLTVKINGLEPKKGLQEILEEAEKKGEIVTAQNATSILNEEKENYALAVEGADLMARYTLLYKQGSADVTQHLVEKIKTMSDVVVTTTNGADYLAGLKKTSKAIRKKQGSGKAS